MSLSLKRTPRYPPREPRRAISIPSSLLLPDDREVPIIVRNISAEGFMGECGARLEPETSLGLMIPGYGIFHATIRWTEDRALGAEFSRPLDLERIPGELSHAA